MISLNIVLLIALVIVIVIILKKSTESFCVKNIIKEPREYEPYYNTSLPLNSVYRDSMKKFLEKSEEDKKVNNSILGSVQNPMSDRNYNTRILYNEPQDVYLF